MKTYHQPTGGDKDFQKFQNRVKNSNFFKSREGPTSQPYDRKSQVTSHAIFRTKIRALRVVEI
jgi:hypothetical protein